MKTNLLQAVRLTLVCIVFFMGIYTVIILGAARLIAPAGGEGETITYNGKTIGYSLIGQSFTTDNYFNGRPSAVSYNAAGSGGSNKGPTNPDYLAQVQQRIDTFLVHNPGTTAAEVPADLVTASGSGEDPDISVEAALVQVPRIARVRNIEPSKLTALINTNIRKPLLNVLGPRRINVLKLNIELNNLK